METISMPRLHFKKYFIFLLLLLLNFKSNAQSPIKVYAVFSDSLRALGQLEGTFYIKIDTTAINATAFLVQVGKYTNDTSIFKHQIAFDPQSVPSGMTYTREGENVRIGITGNKTAWTYYCSLKVRNAQNAWSPATRFLSN